MIRETGSSGTEPPDRYEIRVAGHLGASWDDWFEGLTVFSEADGTTILSGVVEDQAGLHGLLRRIGALGMPLISVNIVENTEHGE
ncbi:MAG: hypothetical protein ABWX92_06440 [Mycetocola sp.]